MNKAEKYNRRAKKYNKEYYTLEDILSEINFLSGGGQFVYRIPYGAITKEVQQSLLDEGFTIESNKNENTTIISWY